MNFKTLFCILLSCNVISIMGSQSAACFNDIPIEELFVVFDSINPTPQESAYGAARYLQTGQLVRNVHRQPQPMQDYCSQLSALLAKITFEKQFQSSVNARRSRQKPDVRAVKPHIATQRLLKAIEEEDDEEEYPCYQQLARQYQQEQIPQGPPPQSPD